MMNIDDKDVNTGPETGFRNFSIRKQLLSTSGAGVNADLRANLAFSMTDPLSELVWSSKNGLGLKYANPRIDERKPLLLWNVGPSNNEGLSPSHSIKRKPFVELRNLTISQASLNAEDIGTDKATLLDASENSHTLKLDPSHVKDLESDKKMVEEVAASRKEIADSREEIAERGKEVSLAIIPATPLKKLESSPAENKLCHLSENGDFTLGGAQLPAENGEGSCTSSRICLYREKGKVKALSDGDICGGSSDAGDDDSHENADSSSSKSTKGVKRQIYDEDAIFGSKRMKKQVHGGDGSYMKLDSSFMKWISNMTKGLSDSNKDDSFSPLPLACSHDIYNKNYKDSLMGMGFQTMFQSLCYRETDPSSTGRKKIVESLQEESREDMVDGEKSLEILPESFENTEKELYPDIAVAMDEVLERSDHRTSLWITRLSTKTLRSEKGKEITEEAIRDESADSKSSASVKESENIMINSEASFEVKSIGELCPVLPSQRFSSEAMASVFARRLDALRHITSSKKGEYSTCSCTCLFCGGCHDVRECPSVAESELEDLLLKLNTFDRGVEESSPLCIRCSRTDHWAVSCPVAPSSWKPLSGLVPTYRTWDVDMSSSKRAPATSVMQRSPPLKSEKDVEQKQMLPLCDIANLQNKVAQSEIFDVIRNLQLTRADILRWMNSNTPLSHLTGFFLRLRLVNLDARLGESSYYVACITGGESRENNGCTSKKTILVDVGGIKSAVASQYVSNHDFLEDEIKAWWSRTMRSGCRIPSLAELNSKFNNRQTLGF